MVGKGGASLRLEAKLKLLAVLSLDVALLMRRERRTDIRTVFSISSRSTSGK